MPIGDSPMQGSLISGMNVGAGGDENTNGLGVSVFRSTAQRATMVGVNVGPRGDEDTNGLGVPVFRSTAQCETIIADNIGARGKQPADDINVTVFGSTAQGDIMGGMNIGARSQRRFDASKISDAGCDDQIFCGLRHVVILASKTGGVQIVAQSARVEPTPSCHAPCCQKNHGGLTLVSFML